MHSLCKCPHNMNYFYNNPDLQHGLEFDCNQQALQDFGAKPLIDFNAFGIYAQFID